MLANVGFPWGVTKAEKEMLADSIGSVELYSKTVCPQGTVTYDRKCGYGFSS